MSRRSSWLARRLPTRREDRGATLVYALLFTTVIALVIAAVLGLADANLRATRALRQQAAEAAAADGAAKLAINTLRTGSYNGTSGQCLDGALALPSTFYQPAQGPAIAARVECAYDDGASVKPGATGAGFALLTVPASGQEGLTLKANGCGSGGSGANCGGMEVHGDVYSTGRTNVDSGQLVIAGDFTSQACLIGTTASIRDDSGPIVVASPECATPSSVGDPGYGLPPGAVPNSDGVWSSCVGNVRTFEPGLYDTGAELNALNNSLPGPPCALSYFKPGIYWFAFNGLWETRNHTVVAGAVTAPPAGVDLATACPSPFTDYNPDAGVVFIFGGNARWRLDIGGRAAVCAAVSEVADQPPIALFGLTSSVTGAAGTISPPAGGSCILRDKDASGGGGAPCATFQTINHTDIELYLNGATYLPRGWVDLDLRSSRQYIVGGLVVRQFSLFAPASATLPEPLSSGPLPGGPGGARTVLYLTVFVCPGATTCTTGGSLRLKAKVAIFDPDGAPSSEGDRPVSVLSWSTQR